MDNGKCMLEEENILKRVSEGDMSAFQDLYYEYYGKTKSFLTPYPGNIRQSLDDEAHPP